MSDDVLTLELQRDPRISPRAVMRLLEDFVPFAVEVFTRRRELFDLPGYEPGLRESNLAVVLAEVATGEGSEADRSSLARTAADALAVVAEKPWEAVSPLAWSYVSYALALLGDEVRSSLRDDLGEKVGLWADRLLDYDFPTGLYRDTKAEETCWTVGPLVGAQVLLRRDPRRSAWQEKANRFFLNSYNREEDLWDETVIEGMPVRDRVCTANVFPDFTTENHGAFHPTYQTCFNNYAIPYILYKRFLGRVPETLVWNWGGLHRVMAGLFDGDGRIVYPGGTDYHPSCHCEQAHYLAIVADALKDPLALWALKKALANVRAFQESNGGRFVGRFLNGEAHIYWEFHFASFLAFAHALAPFDGIAVLDDGGAATQAAGPWVSPYVGILAHKGKKLHAAYALRTVAGKHPGSGFVVPQGSRMWTDYFCGQPQLAPMIRDGAGQAVRLDLTDHVISSSEEEAWVVGGWADERLSIRRTMAFLAHEQGVLHIERIVRYGEQVPIFGSDMDLSRVRAKGEAYAPWSVQTLNYRLANEEAAFRPIRIRGESGEWVARDEEAEWSDDGDWLLIDGRIGLLRLWGQGPWRIAYRRETEPLYPRHFWKHDVWALNVGLSSGTVPRGYGLMGGHAVLFVPASEPEEVAAITRERRAVIQEQHGQFVFSSRLRGWHTTHLIELGHLLRFR